MGKVAAEMVTRVGQEHFQARISPKDSKLDEGEFEGIAAVFGSRVDTFVPTIVEPGAFVKTIREHGKRGVPILWQHDTRMPIGRSSLLREEEVGLRVRGQISTKAAADKLELLREEVVDELSIGFDPVVWEMREDPRGGELVRHLKEVRLHEISIVTIAADRKAKVTEVNEGAGTDGQGEEPEDHQQKGFVAQTVIFPKEHWTLAQARKWAKDNDLKTEKVDETADSFRFRQREPGDFQRLRTICINPGRNVAPSAKECRVKAVGGPIKEGRALDAVADFAGHEPRERVSMAAAILAEIADEVETEILSADSDEAHAGKSISKKNRTLITAAIRALTELLGEDDTDEERKRHLEEEKKKRGRRESDLEDIEMQLREAELAFAEIAIGSPSFVD